MQRREFLTHAIHFGALGGIASFSAGCGTLLHSERCNQPHSNQIDWKIAALDGLGLIFFFVPGVIAFVVDFSTGAIYLPASSVSAPGGYPLVEETTVSDQPLPAAPATQPTPAMQPASLPSTRETSYSPPSIGQPGPPPVPGHGAQLERVRVPRQELLPPRLEHVVSVHAGRSVALNDHSTRVSRLTAVDEFAANCSRHEEDRSFGESVSRFFERMKRA
jgi:hypothetical protein